MYCISHKIKVYLAISFTACLSSCGWPNFNSNSMPSYSSPTLKSKRCLNATRLLWNRWSVYCTIHSRSWKFFFLSGELEGKSWNFTFDLTWEPCASLYFTCYTKHLPYSIAILLTSYPIMESLPCGFEWVGHSCQTCMVAVKSRSNDPHPIRKKWKLNQI